MEKVFIASDNQGYFLKERIKQRFNGKIEFSDLGIHGVEPVFFPLIGMELGKTISAQNGLLKGIIFCDKCIEMNAILNKFPKAKSALILDDLTARLAREKHGANIACMGIHTINEQTAARIIDVFLKTEYKKTEEKK